VEPSHAPEIIAKVEGVNPDLMVRDKEGKPYSIRYDQMNAILLNEFLKEHRTIQEQMAKIARLKSTIEKQDGTERAAAKAN
jgi:GTP cyclohydrolase III